MRANALGLLCTDHMVYSSKNRITCAHLRLVSYTIKVSVITVAISHIGKF